SERRPSPNPPQRGDPRTTLWRPTPSRHHARASGVRLGGGAPVGAVFVASSTVSAHSTLHSGPNATACVPTPVPVALVGECSSPARAARADPTCPSDFHLTLNLSNSRDIRPPALSGYSSFTM